MSEYQSSASDFSNTDCEYNQCRSRGKATAHHHTGPYQDDDDWEQFVSYFKDNESQEITQPTELQDLEGAPLSPINPAIFEWYTPRTVEQIGVEAYKEAIARMYEYYKQYKRDYWNNCNKEYCKTY